MEAEKVIFMRFKIIWFELKKIHPMKKGYFSLPFKMHVNFG